ncbi:MAG: fumarate reductase subunit C [Acidobacteriota bacterium]
MKQIHSHTAYHPRWLRQPVSTYWWLQKPSYFVFILRESSSVFVGWFVVFLLMLVRAVSEGAASYQQFLQWSSTWPIVLLNIVTLLFIVLHTITFFIAAPQALVIRFGGRRVPGRVIVAGHYGAMLAASLVVAWLLLGV